MEKFKIDARMAGVEIPNTPQALQSAPRSVDDMPLTFGAPEDYEHLSQEDREELTNRMTGKHKQWKASTRSLSSRPRPQGA